MMRSRRSLLRSAAIVAVLGFALVVGIQLRGANTPVASPTPSASAVAVVPSASPRASATPSAAATVTGAYNDDFGFVLTEPAAGRTTTVRRESGTRLGSFDQEQLAVSPDGRQLAWFTPSGATAQQLRISSAADVTQSQLLRTISAAERGGPIVWSNDASGLLYQTHSVEPPPSPPSAPGDPSLYVIHTFDLRGTTTPDRVVLTSPIHGNVLLPIAWDRTANVAAVVETGEGGFMGSYDVIRFNGSDASATRTSAPNAQVLAFYMSASSDAKLVLTATFENGGSLSWWPLAGFGARQTIPGSLRGLWRPQTHEVATMGGCAGDPVCGPNGGVRLLDVDTGRSRIVYGATTPNLGMRAFRVDGSAIILAASPAPGTNMYAYTLVPLSGATPVTFKDVNQLLASVRFR